MFLILCDILTPSLSNTFVEVPLHSSSHSYSFVEAHLCSSGCMLFGIVLLECSRTFGHRLFHTAVLVCFGTAGHTLCCIVAGVCSYIFGSRWLSISFDTHMFSHSYTKACTFAHMSFCIPAHFYNSVLAHLCS